MIRRPPRSTRTDTLLPYTPLFRSCPDCASLALQPQGIGTERIEELPARRFDHVPVLRIDRGSTRRQGALEKHFDSLGAGAGVLIGHQMSAKGHDLRHLQLECGVGIDVGPLPATYRAGGETEILLDRVS